MGMMVWNCPDVFVHDHMTGVTTRVSVASDGTQGDGKSGGASISDDGRYVVFSSNATNLVSGDTNNYCAWNGSNNNCSDVFVHDRVTGETIRVSVTSDGTQGNHDSFSPAISADGRYISFDSIADNLVLGDTNDSSDIFVHDRVTSETTRVSVSSDGIQGNDESQTPSISVDGRYVAFSSWANNLVVGDTNAEPDVFVRDREGQSVGYSVSGHITNSEGDPLPGVSISAGYGYSATTDTQGDYTISGLPSGTYSIIPSLKDYFFAPSWHIVSVPIDRVGINFSQGFGAFLPIIHR
jgi:Tol biopolymer transport system component